MVENIMETTNFSAAKAMRFVLACFCQELCNCGLSWNFSPAWSSHVNGIVEQVICMIYQVLESLLGRKHIFRHTCEEFRTLLKEMEAILNRPLVLTHDEITDLSIITLMSLLSPSLPPSHGPAGTQTFFLSAATIIG